MATRPTRLQEQAGDLLAEALLRVMEAVRLDGKSRFGEPEASALLGQLAGASSAFGPEEVVGRAIERRGRALGLRAGSSDLVLLMEERANPLALLLGTDDEFRAAIRALEEELGEV